MSVYIFVWYICIWVCPTTATMKVLVTILDQNMLSCQAAISISVRWLLLAIGKLSHNSLVSQLIFINNDKSHGLSKAFAITFHFWNRNHDKSAYHYYILESIMLKVFQNRRKDSVTKHVLSYFRVEKKYNHCLRLSLCI